ncbi:hypothetical protein AA0472_1936 [Acetobacter estunensis NRIC 0472]|uniref:Uncharacterized protein n=1 Tax=Acetobacter estunensis TaxID=104097 RepID=A0A967EC04_9PROT|nr:hypothetical protein [Acetobacter estunensis]NHO52420.1 hypothetical protein [Acetobacter estunensis]GBQ25939.1 hypothetical protein AA0472_1936 [Acetobacter estunensis NRIC 0472]
MVNDRSGAVREAVYQHGNASHRSQLGSWMLADASRYDRLRLVAELAEEPKDVSKAKLLLPTDEM